MTALVLAVLLALLLACPSVAAPSPADPRTDDPQSALPVPAAPQSAVAPAGGLHALDAADAEAWLDGLIPSILSTTDGPGAAVAVVKGGKVLLAKGYGATDQWSAGDPLGTPVDPERTLFRLGSVTKLFTAIAAMQLVKDGRLDLDAGITQYIDVPLDLPMGEPTVRDLMTHTAGFEEYLGQILVKDPAAPQPSLEEVARDQPAQVHAPGTVSAYSNYGVTLLGLIVEKVGGKPWTDTVRDRILAPLGMTHSTMLQPVPTDIDGSVAQGFTDPAQSTGAQPFERIGMAPAGGGSATAADMARFANFLLGHGPDGVLDEATLDQMTSPAIDTQKAPLYATSPNTMGLQFFVTTTNGVRVVGHEGDLTQAHAMVWVFPEHDTGLVVMQNGLGSGNKGDVRPVLVQQFVERYLAARPEVPDAAAGAHEAARALAGTYVSSRIQYSGIMRTSIPLSEVTVVANEDDTVSLTGSPARWRMVRDGVWQAVDGKGSGPIGATFVTDGTTILHVPAHELRRQEFLDSSTFLWLVLALALPAALGTLLVFVVGARHRRHLLKFAPDSPIVDEGGLERWSRRAMVLVGLGTLLAFIALAVFSALSTAALKPEIVSFRVVQAGLALVALGGVAALARLVTAVGRRRWGAALWALFVAAGTAATLFLCWHHNLFALVPRM
ncbi:serine hydrolase [Schaalia sp. 19OD2882]|uniref:serine hydrolase domain-containing protein n=1 Tax=Schaalia sp. 19OD2882 TaxID=2794089 RepID=UPI001C1EA8C9|nr:serine hydrolase domain-containing protein [Schaalia sp. 19OD2882]QWW20233.1 serine hydrolase [Schaalia sp. 19OD2882]